MKKRIVFFLCVTISWFFAPPATALVLDSFVTDQGPLSLAVSGVSGTETFSGLSDPAVVGGHRDLGLLFGRGPGIVTGETSGGAARFDGSGATGSFTGAFAFSNGLVLEYDGDETVPPLSIAPENLFIVGLSSFDFTEGGKNDRFVFSFTSITAPLRLSILIFVPLSLTFHTFTTVLTSVDINSPTDFVIPFADILSLPFPAVGSIRFRFGTGNGAFVLNEIRAVGTLPEPATIAIFGLGLAGLGFMMRRRKLN